MTRALRVVLTTAALFACRPAPPPVEPSPVARDGLGTTLGAACVRLRDLGCPEGGPTKQGRTCFEHLSGLAELVDVPAACVAGASSRDAVRACGSSATTRFRCAE